MKFQPMGYQAVHTRMAQLQMRLDGQFGKKTEQGIGAPAMNKSAFAGMSSSIGDGNEPMSPFGGRKSEDVDRSRTESSDDSGCRDFGRCRF